MESTIAIIFTLFVVVCIPLIIYLGKKQKIKAGKVFKETFGNLKDFQLDNYYTPASYFMSKESLIGFDNKNKKICFFRINDSTRTPYIYNFDKILQCEIIVDNETIVKQSTSSTVGRAVLGGILTGGVGAIVGGMTGKTNTKEIVKNIDLKIIMDDPVNPIFKVNFLNVETDKKSELYKMAYENAEKWHAILSGLIRQGSNN
jgi:hypothetical protein